MAKTTFRRWEADQAELFPPSVRDQVPADHLVHFVRKLVEEDLDLSAIYDSDVREAMRTPHAAARAPAQVIPAGAARSAKSDPDTREATHAAGRRIGTGSKRRLRRAARPTD